MSKHVFLFCILFGFTAPAVAQEFRWDLEWYNTASRVEKKNSGIIDPTGRRLNSPTGRLETDLRLNSKYTTKRGNRFAFRPRLLGNASQYFYSDNNETKIIGKTTLSLPEAYVEGEPSNTVTLSMGLQNYQWGPAEFISPSNPLFHFNPQQRAYNFKDDGRFLLRMNWSPNPRWSFVSIAEPMNNGNSFWIYDRKFQPKGLIKVERRGKNSLNYIGLDGGIIEESMPFVGEYFNFEIKEGFSIYLDNRTTYGSALYEPRISSDGLHDMIYYVDESSWNTLLDAGIRWEGRADLRLEYIYNSYGLNQDLMTMAFQSAVPQHPRGNENLQRLLRSGSELLGQEYGYFSLRIPDLFIQNNNLSFRYLQSLMDSSGTFQLAWDTALGDSTTVYIDATVSQGGDTQELSALEKGSGQIGFKMNF